MQKIDLFIHRSDNNYITFRVHTEWIKSNVVLYRFVRFLYKNN